MSARLHVVLRTQQPAPVTWARLVDPRRHTRAVPLTTVTGRLDRPGARVVARTGIGPLGFDDVMVVDAADGQRLVVRKVGRVVRGGIEARVRPDGAGSTLEWQQRIAITGLPRALDPLVAVVARSAYRAALRRILADVAG